MDLTNWSNGMNNAKQNLTDFINQHSAAKPASDKAVRERLNVFIKSHDKVREPQAKLPLAFPKIDLIADMWASMWRIKDYRESLACQQACA